MGYIDRHAALEVRRRVRIIQARLQEAEHVLDGLYSELTDQLLADEAIEHEDAVAKEQEWNLAMEALENFYEFQRKVDGGYITPADPEYVEFVDCGWTPENDSQEAPTWPMTSRTIPSSSSTTERSPQPSIA
jgi:hypothetical protein